MTEYSAETIEAGKKFIESMGNITIDPDELRVVARRMKTHAENLAPIATSASNISSTASAQAAEFTRNHQPAPIYADTITGLKHTGTAFKTNIDKIATQLSSDAELLRYVADAQDASTEEHVEKVNQIAPETTTV